MSSGPRERIRPTRDETKAKLLDAAAVLFAEHGIGSSNIEDICRAAGFSRGAFYSSFGTKDDLVFELLDIHFEANQVEADRLYDLSDNTVEFVAAMSSDERRRTLPVEDVGLLYMELTLYALRNKKNRARLVERQRRDFAMMGGFVERIIEAEGLEVPGDLDDIVHLLLALDTGILLHALIDPEHHDPERWARIVITLRQLLPSAPSAS